MFDFNSIPVTTSTIHVNQWVDYWFYQVGVNPLPRVEKRPIIKYKEYNNKRIPEELLNQWNSEDKFNNNMCIMVGKISGHTDTLNYARKGLYLNFADLDNQLAIDKFCTYKGKQFTIDEMAKIVILVQHSDDPTHCHVYWLASKALAKRTLDKEKKNLGQIRNNQLPAIEIKAAGDVAFCPGGYHESGNPYEPIGTNELFIIEELGEHIESICRKYKLPVSDTERNRLRILNANAISKKSKPKDKLLTNFDSEDLNDNEEWCEIFENSRNNTLFDRARKYFRKNKDLLSTENFRKIVTFHGIRNTANHHYQSLKLMGSAVVY